MTKQEFEKRVGFEVSQNCYEKWIEPKYMSSELDKDVWCKQWKRKGGIHQVLSYEQGRAEQAIEMAKDFKRRLSHMIDLVNIKEQEIAELRKQLAILKKYKDAADKIKGITAEI